MIESKVLSLSSLSNALSNGFSAFLTISRDNVKVKYIISLIAGGIMPLAFAPINLWFFALICPFILLHLWMNASPKQAAKIGFCFGVGLFGIGTTWIYVSIHQYGNTDVPLAILITALFVAILSSYFAIQGYLVRKFFKENRYAYCLLGFPCIWVLMEWLRSIFMGGFPWLYLGYSQVLTPLKGYAPIIGVYGISFLILITIGLFAIYFHETRWNKKGPILLSILILWGTGHLLSDYSFAQVEKKEYTVSLVQGNVNPLDKFSFEYPIRAVEKNYGQLTKDHWKQDLIIWPENAIPFSLPEATPYIEKLNNLAKKNKSSLISGIQTRFNDKDYYNSLIVAGENQGIYHKKHLVPFGEFLPFESLLRGLINFFDIPMSNFIEGPNSQAPLKIKDFQIIPLICYEIAYPELVRDSFNNLNKNNPSVIVTISEDGWFGNSWGPHQHLEIAQMRALETGRYILRATTSGITAIIKPDGQIQAIAPQFQPYVLSGTFQVVNGITPLMYFGQWPVLLLLLLGFCLPGCFLGLRKK